MTRLVRIFLTTLVTAFASPAISQTLPAGPVQLVVGFTPGGVIDGFARQLAPELSKALGQPVVVENKPGANGIIAMNYVARSKPNGQTIFIGAFGNFILNPFLNKSLPYNLETDFAPVTQLNSVSFLLFVNPDIPVKDVSSFIEYIKKSPSKLHFSSTGPGSAPDLAAELFNSLAGVSTVQVPYKGSGDSMLALVSNQVQFTFDAVAIGMPLVNAGKLHVLGATGAKRLPQLPDVPALAETLPGYEVTNWYGLVVPAATPKDYVDTLQRDVAIIVNSPKMRSQMAAQGMDPIGSTPAAFGEFLQSEKTKWAKVVKAAGLVPK